MNYLEIVEYLINSGIPEDIANKEAYLMTYGNDYPYEEED